MTRRALFAENDYRGESEDMEKSRRLA